MVRHGIRHAPVLVLTALLLALTAQTPGAHAKPPVKPGPVTGLTMALSTPGDNFQVNASWNAATNATTYAVALTNAATGAALAGNTVGVTSWSVSVNLAGVSQVRLTVTPYNQRPGTAASITQDVPDLNAPNGTYTTSWVERTGTITQTSLTDDGPIGQVTRTVSWGDGSAAEAWANGNSISHLYAADGLYRPTVTLKDTNGNNRVVTVPPIVPGDKKAPIGTFTTTPGKAWAAVTTVTVTQTALRDELTGTATDDKGTGVDEVAVLAIEKRATGWYFYKAGTKTWAKAATKAKAWKRARAATAEPSAKGVWTIRLAGLRKGTLFVRATATDLAGNASKPAAHKAVLTAP